MHHTIVRNIDETPQLNVKLNPDRILFIGFPDVAANYFDAWILAGVLDDG
ncbi:hypothetical protein [Nitrosomonas marina]|uniref:Uncharacterized protein n=1 Tax=Nitrosomonas marina TaxID=917 RepID=A0A1H8AFU9_9PROT|nr:hypothetical protein [Nitrosomonas marina]SEM68417.1 hypothetical protein SAMN05216325_10179 [Nitrosomonas marina]